MDLNDMIEQEIKRQVEVRVQEELNKWKADFVNNLKHTLTAKVCEAVEELSFCGDKCEYKDCQNYKNGALDDACLHCDSRKIKQQKDQKVTANLRNSKVNQPKEDKSGTDDEYVDDSNKFAEELLTQFADTLKAFGITEDEIRVAQERMNDPATRKYVIDIMNKLGFANI